MSDRNRYEKFNDTNGRVSALMLDSYGNPLQAGEVRILVTPASGDDSAGEGVLLTLIHPWDGIGKSTAGVMTCTEALDLADALKRACGEQ